MPGDRLLLPVTRRFQGFAGILFQYQGTGFLQAIPPSKAPTRVTATTAINSTDVVRDWSARARVTFPVGEHGGRFSSFLSVMNLREAVNRRNGMSGVWGVVWWGGGEGGGGGGVCAGRDLCRKREFVNACTRVRWVK